MKTKFYALILAAAILLPVHANAFFLTSMVNGMTSVANNMVDGATEVSTSSLDLMSKLSDDIGIMANRILTMADKIGEMADRIVATEQLMADMTVQLAQISANTSNSSTSTQSTNDVVISAGYQTTLYQGQAPYFTVSDSSVSEFIVYVSPTLIMDVDTTAVVVHSMSQFQSKWNQLAALAKNNKVYIAVKTIKQNLISSRSNVLEYTTLY